MLFSKITLLEINYKTVMKKNDEKSIFKNDSWRATQNQLFISIMCLHINISNRLFPIFVFQEYYIKSINLELIEVIWSSREENIVMSILLGDANQ